MAISILTPADIQTAVNAAVAGGGGEVIIPPGRWQISAPIKISGRPVPVYLRGSGTSSIIKAQYKDDPVILYKDGDNTRLTNACVSDLVISRSPSHAIDNGIGLELIEQPWCRVDRVQFVNLDIGLRMTNCGDIVVSRCIFVALHKEHYLGIYPHTGPDMLNVKNGIVFDNPANGPNNLIECCRFTVTDTMISLRGAQATHVNDCQGFNLQFKYGIRFIGSSNNLFVSRCGFEGAKTAISLDKDSSFVSINNCVFGPSNQSGGVGIQVNDDSNVIRIAGNRFMAATAAAIKAIRADNLCISDNQFTHQLNSANCIIVDGCHNSTIANNLFAVGSSPGMDGGIYVSKHISGRISKNICLQGNNFMGFSGKAVVSNDAANIIVDKGNFT